MSTKEVKGVTIPRHDIAKNWAKAINFVPKKGEIIVYDADAPDIHYEGDGSTADGNFHYTSSSVTRFKFGDGNTNVNHLPFGNVSEDVLNMIDLSYSPHSTNAQSGKAVAEAIDTTLNSNKTGELNFTFDIDDVSPIDHKMKVKLISEKHEVNMFDISTFTSNTYFMSDPEDNTITVTFDDGSEVYSTQTLSDLCPQLKAGDEIKFVATYLDILTEAGENRFQEMGESPYPAETVIRLEKKWDDDGSTVWLGLNADEINEWKECTGDFYTLKQEDLDARLCVSGLPTVFHTPTIKDFQIILKADKITDFSGYHIYIMDGEYNYLDESTYYSNTNGVITGVNAYGPEINIVVFDNLGERVVNDITISCDYNRNLDSLKTYVKSLKDSKHASAVPLTGTGNLNLKTINNNSIIGTGNIAIDVPDASTKMDTFGNVTGDVTNGYVIDVGEGVELKTESGNSVKLDSDYLTLKGNNGLKIITPLTLESDTLYFNNNIIQSTVGYNNNPEIVLFNNIELGQNDTNFYQNTFIHPSGIETMGEIKIGDAVLKLEYDSYSNPSLKIKRVYGNSGDDAISITNIATPKNDNDVANKVYVDNIITPLTTKEYVDNLITPLTTKEYVNNLIGVGTEEDMNNNTTSLFFVVLDE